jgi:crotonobetainyl-CoA:carnitine CoA-transferase CaiB-like acyl-CoA transferase
MGGVLRQRSGSVLPGVAPSNVYPTADGEDVVLAANADTVFQRLVALMGRPELATDADYATHQSRGANSGTLDELIASWTSQYKSAELLTKLSEGGVPAGLINTAATILRDEHFLARDMIVWRQAGEWNVPMNGVVPKFSRTPGSIREIGPELGAHTDAVLTALAGVDADELARLHEDGVV